jgi:gliding motility-associated-like protein
MGQSYYALDFEENKGQWTGDFNYLTNLGDSRIFFHSNGFTVLKQHPDDLAIVNNKIHGGGVTEIKAPVNITAGMEGACVQSQEELITIRKHAFKVRFLGSNGVKNFTPERPTGEVSNYFLGDKPDRWKKNVKKYASLVGKDLYTGIDIKYYGDGDRLKYDLIVHPGANLSGVRIAYDGVDKLSLKNGSLLIQTSVGEVKELPPYAYQIIGGLKKEIQCRYVIDNGSVGFKVGDYDKTQVLYVDPIFLITTFSGSRSNNWGFTAAPGPDGSLYAGGIVFGEEYPLSIGAFQSTFVSGSGPFVDIGLTRFSPDGTSRIYSTYIGGRENEFPHSIYVDPVGNAVILGRTNSNNFPKKNVFGGGGGAADLFVIKLSADGTTMIGGAIIGGTGLDGANQETGLNTTNINNELVYNYGDHSRSEVIIDNAGFVYVAASSNSVDFPTKNAAQSRLAGMQDGVVIKLTPNLTDMVYSTYLGGSSNDAAFVLAHNPLNNSVYVAGVTQSTDFAGDKTGTIGQSFQGDVDGFITQLNSSGVIQRTSYLATTTKDFVYGVQIDTEGFPYVMGITLGSWPVVNAKTFNEGSKQFISKLQPDLSNYVYSTVFGSPNSDLPNISPVAFLVDKCGNVYISGWGGGCENACANLDRACNPFFRRISGTRNMPMKGIPVQNYTDNRDFYFYVLKDDATEQLFGSFYGQFGGYIDHVDGGTSRFDSQGRIYQAFCANCGGRDACPIDPVSRPLRIAPSASVAQTNGALRPNSRDVVCNLFAIRLDFELSNVASGIKSYINGVANDNIGCVPLKVDFVDTIDMGVRYFWDFGDGTLDTTETPNNSHLFNAVGNYRVMLIAENPERCIQMDTSYQDIFVRNNKAELKADYAKKGPCTSLSYTFDNLSLPAPGQAFGVNAFEWDFGDKSPRQKAGTNPVDHTFPAVGTYVVKLYLRDPAFCNTDDFIQLVVSVNPQLRASFKVDSITCVPKSVKFSNTSQGGKTFTWDFGPSASPSTGNGYDPGLVKFNQSGDYLVKLTAEDPGTCNKIDDTTIIVRVRPKPFSDFDVDPSKPVENIPIRFINKSVGAIKYNWEFGDGAESSAKDLIHEYPKSDKYLATLTVTNEFGCSDDTTKLVEAIIFPIADVPSAFTPNNDGVNDVLQLKAFGVSQMIFRVYNRWGQEVFVSANASIGWDGKYRGELQPTDVYGYTLSIVFTNGATINKKGEITLIR